MTMVLCRQGHMLQVTDGWDAGGGRGVRGVKNLPRCSPCIWTMPELEKEHDAVITLGLFGSWRQSLHVDYARVRSVATIPFLHVD